MLRSPLRFVLLWVLLLIALGSCSADSQVPEGMGGAGRVAAPVGEEPGGQAAMPATLRMASLRAQQKAVGYDFVRDAGGTLRSKAGGHGATAAVAATARGVHLSGEGHGELGVETTSVGREARPASRGVVQQRADGQELVLDREDGVEERYLAGPLGVEHSYLVREKRAGNGPLVIAVAFAGLAPEGVAGATDRVRLVDEKGQVRGAYRDLVVADAEGREIAAHMEVRGHRVALVIDDAAATYPLRVDPLVWLQQQKLTASDGAANDYFGLSIAMSGDTAVVGAPLDDDKGLNSGSAYVFVRTGGVWTQQQKLTAVDGAASDKFGESVALSGDTAVIGASLDDDKGLNSGSAYVFVRSGGVWTQQQKLTAVDGAASDLFGVSVALSGDTAVIGAGYDDDLGSGSGSAYVFVRSGGVWTQQQKLTAVDGAAGDAFGYSVAVSGDTAIIGAWQDGDLGNASGSAYVFMRSGSVWIQQQKLTGSGGAAYDTFGISVAVSGDTAIIGARAWDSVGAAYVFVRSGSVWTEQQRLTASDGQVSDNFGCSVAFSGDTAVIGAQLDEDNGDSSGSAYVFVRSGTVWTEQQKLTASDGVFGDHFGISVAVFGDTAIITAHQDDGKGAAYVFTQQEANGMACASGSACASGLCVDGVCCDTACNAGACDACSIAAGAPSDGTCALFTGTACNDGNVCTQTDTCQAGVCTGGNPVTCTASDQCHAAGTCNPATGVCSNPSKANGTACNDGSACSKSDVCTSGACGGTAYTCTPTSCQATSTCDGNGGCTIVSKGAGVACPDDGNACSSDTCDGAGACQHPSKADGTSCGAGQVCASGSCASGCFIGGTLYAASTVNPANACLVCTPGSSTTAWSSRADGTSCDDSNACTKSDTCTEGTCGGTAYTCTPTSCQTSSTCNGNGGCTIVNKPSGAACPDDGNACSSDTCNGAGTCAHATLSDGTSCGAGQLCAGGSCGPKCQIGGQLHAAGTINPANACEQCAPATSTSAWSSRADGTSCADGNACTKNDVCTAGACGGTAYTCTPGACDASSTCDGNGGCTVTPKGSGVACPDDGNPCSGDSCNGAGICAHPTLADGTTCAVGQVCNGGACAAECFIGGVLVAAGSANPANACEVCAPLTSSTSWSSKAGGAACDDGNACTKTDTCQAGVCTGGDPVVCAASDACHDVGTCDSATGQCESPAKTDGATCDDGDACSQTDSCVSGVCVGRNAKSCPAIDECHVDGTCDKANGDCVAPAKADGETCSIGTCQGGVCTAAPDGGMAGSSGTGGSMSTGGTGGSMSTGGTGGSMSTGGTGGSTSTGGSGGTGGTGGTGGSRSTGGSGDTGGSSSTSSGTAPDQAGGCSCRAAGADEGSERGPMDLVVGLMLAAGVSRRRGRGVRRAA